MNWTNESINSFAPRLPPMNQPSIAQRLARCNTALSKWQIFSAMAGNGKLNINGLDVILASVMREDGSGSSFILMVSYGQQYYQSYVRTTD